MNYIIKKRRNALVLLGLALALGVCGCGTDNEIRVEDENKAPVAVTEAVVEEKTEEGTVLSEEQILQALMSEEDLYFTSGGVADAELIGNEIEEATSYFIMKKYNGQGGEELYIGVMGTESGALLQCDVYANTTADAEMTRTEQGTYIMYCTECTDFGLISGNGGVLLAKAGKLTPVWPLAEDGTLDGAFWNQRTAKLNGTAFELYKVITEEEIPGVPALQSETEFERTITLEEILGESEK